MWERTDMPTYTHVRYCGVLTPLVVFVVVVVVVVVVVAIVVTV